jgi:hypothetical protein
MTDTFARRLAAALFVLTAVVLGAALRWHEIDVSLWLDEVFTYEGANRSMWHALGHRSYPLYYALANIALRFENSEIGLRFPSLIAGVLTIPAIFYFSARMSGARVAILTTLFITVNTYHIRFSQEARFYSLVMLGSVLMTWFLYRALTRGWTRDWIAFTAAAYFSLVSQLSVIPFFAAMLAGAVGWTLATGFKNQRCIPWRTIVGLGVSAAIAVTGLFAGLLTRNSTVLAVLDWVQWESASAGDAGKVVQVYRLTIPQYTEFILQFTPLQPMSLRLVLAGLACVGIGALWRQNRCLAAILSAQFIIAPIPYLLLDSDHWFVPRYFCSLTPLYLLLIATGIVAATSMAVRVFPRKDSGDGESAPGSQTSDGDIPPTRAAARLGIVLLIIVVSALTPFHVNAISRYYRSRPETDWKGLARYMAERIQPHETIVLLPPPDGIVPRGIGVFRTPLHYYLVRILPTYFPDNHYAVMGTLRYRGARNMDALNGLLAETAGAEIWFVFRNEQGIPEGFPQAIRESGATIQKRFGGIQVRHRLATSETSPNQDDSAPATPLE